jgi:hypothetical protein
MIRGPFPAISWSQVQVRRTSICFVEHGRIKLNAKHYSGLNEKTLPKKKAPWLFKNLGIADVNE